MKNDDLFSYLVATDELDEFLGLGAGLRRGPPAPPETAAVRPLYRVHIPRL